VAALKLFDEVLVMPAQEITASPSAERLRRHRERRRKGLRSISVDVSEKEIAYFGQMPRVAIVQRDDRNSLSIGLRAFLDDAFRRARRRDNGMVFEIRLHDSAIDQLVRLGCLESSRREDRQAVLTAFIATGERFLFGAP
jgi:hypothetical protein